MPIMLPACDPTQPVTMEALDAMMCHHPTGGRLCAQGVMRDARGGPSAGYGGGRLLLYAGRGSLAALRRACAGDPSAAAPPGARPRCCHGRHRGHHPLQGMAGEQLQRAAHSAYVAPSCTAERERCKRCNVNLAIYALTCADLLLPFIAQTCSAAIAAQLTAAHRSRAGPFVVPLLCMLTTSASLREHECCMLNSCQCWCS